MKIFNRSRKGSPGQAPAEVEDLLHNLSLLARTEANIAAFYQRCAELLPEERSFWSEMAASERHHAATIHRLIQLMTDQPHMFRPGRAFNPASIRIFDLFVRGLAERTDLQHLAPRELLGLAVEIENSAIELHYHQIVVSSHPEFVQLTQEIDVETKEHRQQLEERLADLSTS